jgi:putative transposase
MARSVYYYWCHALNRPDAYEHEKHLIEAVFHRHKGRYGYRRIMWSLRRQGCWLNHKTVQKLMRQLGLKSTVRPKKYRSYRGSLGRIAPNELNRSFETLEPNSKWVTDVTEFNIRGEKVYLSPVLDLYNREIIAYQIARTAHFPLVMTMLSKALSHLKRGERPLLHSDQGWQYQMEAYQKALADKGVRPSMSRKGNCLDNSVIENFFGLLKTEFFHGHRFADVETFITKLKAYIHYYNHERIKVKLKGLSPVEYRTQALLAA